MLRAKGQRTRKADMVRNIIPAGVECIFVRQAEQLGLGPCGFVRGTCCWW
jgi:UTP--glucose-1-phosphate uridylyltransferase